jgi:hypothetical protein
VVTVHEQPINAFGWYGSGYIITDPNTGAGAYKISAGAGGGVLKTIANKRMFWAGAFKNLFSANIVAKSILGSVGQIISTFMNAYKFFTKCSSLQAALVLTLVFALISVVISILLFFFFSPLAFFLSIAIGLLESLAADKVMSYGC